VEGHTSSITASTNTAKTLTTSTTTESLKEMKGLCSYLYRLINRSLTKEMEEVQANTASLSLSGNRVDDVFVACDAKSDGQLDLSETKYACQALGYYPKFPDEIERAMEKLNAHFPLNKEGLTNLTAALDKSGCKQAIPAVPYSLRGLTLRQIKLIGKGLLKTNWLQDQCDTFNREHKDEIDNKTKFEMIPNLYSMDKSFVQATTSTDGKARDSIADDVLEIIGVPNAPAETCCYAQLINPQGLEVDYFISHYWGHEFERTVTALSNFAEQVYQDIKKDSADDVVFWICLFALNQHQAEDEVGSTPEEGPFNVALAKAKSGAVMVLDGSAQPMHRIWCLFEIARAKRFDKDFQLITDDGDLEKAPIEMMDKISMNLIKLRASKANASNEDDKNAIHYRILNPYFKKSYSFEFFKTILAPAMSKDSDSEIYFVEFDRHVCKLIATPLLIAGIKAESKDVCMRAIGMGAEVTNTNLEALKQRHTIDMKTATVESRDGNVGLAFIFARTGQVDQLKFVLDCGADISGKDKEGATPLHWAAEEGKVDVCELLLKGGAEIDEKDARGNTPLHNAALHGHMNLCEFLLNSGANIDEKSTDGYTPLHYAAGIGHMNVCEFLLNRGANIDEKDNAGKTPLHHATYATEMGHMNICELLREWRKS